MPAPIHARLRIGGTLYGDASWSVGASFAQENGTDPFSAGVLDVPGALQAWADAMKARHGGHIFPDTLWSVLSSSTAVTFIRASRIGLDGKESDVALIEMPPLAMGGAAGKHPAQTAVVASLQTGRPGASYRGRMYWPCIGLTCTGGRVDNSEIGAVSEGTATYLQEAADSLQAAIPTMPFSAQPVVVSVAKGALTRVTSVRVGNRFDSQRRRAEGQEEIYRVAAVAS